MSLDTKKSVVLIGWNPEVVDYKKWPHFNVEKLRNMLEADRDRLIELGFEAQLFYIDSADTAFENTKQFLSLHQFDCVLIGAGVRTDSDHFIVFEQLINAVHLAAPNAKICFNTNPTDTAEAVQRWI